jgi:mannosyltransferase
LALALINAAGLYTQYSYPFTMLAQGVMFVAWIGWASRRAFRQGGFGSPPLQHRVLRRAIREYAALNLLTLILFTPWLPTAWDQVMNWPRTGVDLALTEQARTVWTWITYGNTAGKVVWWSFAWPGVLILAALVLPDRRRLPHGWRVGLPLVWGGIVSGALLVSGAYREANLKFLLPAQIAAALLIGCGVWRLWVTTGPVLRVTPLKMRYIRRVIAAVCLFLLVIGQLEALEALYNDPAYARDDYRAIVARITADLRPGDAIILDAPNQWETFTYYYDGEAPVYPLPRGLGGDDNQTRAEVRDVIAAHDRVFVLFWGEEERDPNRIVQATLDAEAYPVSSAWYGDVRLAVYVVLGAAPTEPDTVTDARFGDHIRLTGYALGADTLRPGDVIGVTLFWTTDARLDVRYKVTVQLLAPDGTLVYQHDGEPGNNRALTTTWEPGAAVIDSHGLVVPPDLAPGAYTIIVGLYDINAPLDRLPVTVDGESEGDVFTLATLEPEG